MFIFIHQWNILDITIYDYVFFVRKYLTPSLKNVLSFFIQAKNETMNSLIYRMTQQYFTKEIYYVAAMVCLASKYKKVRKLRTKHNHSLPEKFSRIPIHACSNLHTQKIVRGNGIYAATYVSRTHVQARAHKHISTGYARVPFSRVCSSARSLACLPSALNSVCISLCGSWRFRA